MPTGRAGTPARGQGKVPATPATAQRPRAVDISWGVGDGRGDGSGMEAKGAAAYLGFLVSEGPPASSGRSSAGRHPGEAAPASRGRAGATGTVGAPRIPQLQRNAPRRSQSVGGRPVTRWSGTGPAGPPALLGAIPPQLRERRLVVQEPLPAAGASPASRAGEGLAPTAMAASPALHSKDESGTSGARPLGRPPAHPDRQTAQQRQPTPPQSSVKVDGSLVQAHRVAQSPLTRSQSFVVPPTTYSRVEARPPAQEERHPEPAVSAEQIADLSKLLSVNRFDLQPGAKRIP